jgi:putative flippase GtrA
MARVASLARRLYDPSLGRFLLVGLSNTALSYAVFRLCLWVLPAFALRATVSQVVSYGSGIAWSFLWNRIWTFKSQAPAARQGIRFVTLQLSMAALSSALVGLSVDALRLPATPSWVAVMGLVTVVNYLGSRYWVFRDPG